MIKKCIGCGSVLQTEDKNKIGYTPNIKKEYCMRCFRLKNYGEEKEENVDPNKVIKEINKKKEGIVFFFVDFLNINHETVGFYKQIKLPKVFVVSKCDTLRKDMKYNKIINWLNKVYKIKEDVLFISGKKNYSSYNLFKYMDMNGDKTAYLMGITNAGKSTYINDLLKTNGIFKETVVSKKANTTLDFIKFKIGDYYIYDTPGLNYTTYDKKLIEKEIKPITYQIIRETTFVINDNLKFTFTSPNSVTFYLTCDKIKRVYQHSEETIHDIKIGDNEDFIIPGVGYFNIKTKTNFLANIKEFEIRKNLSGEEYE